MGLCVAAAACAFFSFLYLIPRFLSGVTQLLSSHNDPGRKLKGLKVLLP